jgi:hypothetical protein
MRIKSGIKIKCNNIIRDEIEKKIYQENEKKINKKNGDYI